ncbi:GNAT family N-acetyltransferase [Streptomyces incarnatus]|uniref:GNAT family N-acetyltransferase n=1 Tax=Streptomyces incarnatus TaxID=665007 RepID=UPI000AAB6250|nr:GNAT family N-acetyltransferase [Streptomyces incarnatus]
MNIRAAVPADADDVYRLLSGFVTSYRPERGLFDRVTFPRVLDAAASGGAEFLVAQQKVRVVGYVLGLRLPTLFAGRTVLEVLELAVDAPLQGRGTGSALIRKKVEATVNVPVKVPVKVVTKDNVAGFSG